MYVYEMLGAEVLTNLYDRLGRQLMDPQLSAGWQVMSLSYPRIDNAVTTRSSWSHSRISRSSPSLGHGSAVIWLSVHSRDHRRELLGCYSRSYRSDPQNQHQQRHAGRYRHVHHRYPTSGTINAPLVPPYLHLCYNSPLPPAPQDLWPSGWPTTLSCWRGYYPWCSRA